MSVLASRADAVLVLEKKCLVDMLATHKPQKEHCCPFLAGSSLDHWCWIFFCGDPKYPQVQVKSPYSPPAITVILPWYLVWRHASGCFSTAFEGSDLSKGIGIDLGIVP